MSFFDKKDIIEKMSQYFPKPFRSFRGNINLKLFFQIMQQKLILKM